MVIFIFIFFGLAFILDSLAYKMADKNETSVEVATDSSTSTTKQKRASKETNTDQQPKRKGVTIVLANGR